MDSTPTTWLYDPVDAPSTHVETVCRLGSAIRIGLLAPGDRLPPERELADQFGISRSTLRQALAALTGTGHLVAVRGRSGGTFVTPTPPITSAEPFPADDRRRLLDWRMTLELGTVGLAADHAGNGARALLDDAAQRLVDVPAADDRVAFRRADAVFHLRLAEAAGSRRLMSEMSRIQGALSDMLQDVERPQGAYEICLDQHHEVLDAVMAGDAEGARDAMRRHLLVTERRLDARTV